jgi:hypothetical protein
MTSLTQGWGSERRVGGLNRALLRPKLSKAGVGPGAGISGSSRRDPRRIRPPRPTPNLIAILRWRVRVVRRIRVVLGNSRDQLVADQRLQVGFDRIRQRLSIHFITVDIEREGF